LQCKFAAREQASRLDQFFSLPRAPVDSM
jgi:hypothetical protein